MQHLTGTKIKNLQVLLTKKELEKEELNREFNAIQSRRDKCNNQIQKYKNEIKQLSAASDSLIVSEHAIIRYLQRVYALDLEKITQEIVPPTLSKEIKELGSGTYKCEGFAIKVVDGVVVTVLDN